MRPKNYIAVFKLKNNIFFKKQFVTKVFYFLDINAKMWYFETFYDLLKGKHFPHVCVSEQQPCEGPYYF